MKAIYSDVLRMKVHVFLEPLLETGCKHMARKVGAGTSSKYKRYAIINQLIQDGYPLDRLSRKFAAFYKSLKK
jgi:hypothetical protein